VNGNLTKAEKSGLKSLKKRIEQDGIVVYQTDKSGRFTVDAIHNYREACHTQTENDPTVNQNFYEKIQKQANAHSTFWVRILRTGEETGGQARIKGNILVQDCTLPPLYALRKDHKHIVNPVNEQGVRPICGAVSAYNRKLSYLMSFILNEVWKEAESVCMNIEEMLADFKRLNVDHITEDIIVGSADVKALYPSFDVTFTVEKVCEIFHSSSIKVIGIDTEELGLYLALNETEAELGDLDILRFCPTRKTNRGRPPTITGCAIDNNKDKRFGPWLPPKEEPDELTTRRMFTIAMKVTPLFIMENHMYTFDNEIKLQSRGGPIGLQLTGVLAQLFMVWWDREFEHKMKEIELRLWMYKRYVDDVNSIMSVPKMGLRFEGSNLVEGEVAAEEDRLIELDEIAMRLFKSVADSIHTSVEMEIDCSSCHDDHKLPMGTLFKGLDRG
jgi:hypothetical protein